ncbi:MAG: hypothetical protein L0Z52_12050 [Acidobacteria bacterium]|nr:hypothetical protein [Acidobacteriota bacterium]
MRQEAHGSPVRPWLRALCAAVLGLAVMIGLARIAWAEPASHEGRAGAATSTDHSAAHPTAAASQEDPHAHHGAGQGLVRGGITREEERAYSLFMHRSCGLALIALGALILADRLTQRRYGAIRKAMGVVWLLLGIHVFLNADPTDWPVAASFMESWTRAESGEWLQHKVLSLIPMAMGLFAMLAARRRTEMRPWQGYALAAIMSLGGIGLMIHEHQHSPGMDMALIEKQHNLMALTALFIAAGSAGDGLQRLAWKAKRYLVPVGLILLGIQLAAYTE